jgi:hypothetical protein
MKPFISKINLCVSAIALLISSLPAQANPIYFDIAQSFDDGSTSKFNFTYDADTFELTNVSSVRIRDANGRITVPLQDFGVIQLDPDFSSSILVFIFNNLTTNVVEALAYNGVTSSFDEAGASLTDDRRIFIEQNWSKRVGDPNQGGNIKINGKPLGFVFSEKEHEHEHDGESNGGGSSQNSDLSTASVPEPNILALLLAGLLGVSLTSQIKKILFVKKTSIQA